VPGLAKMPALSSIDFSSCCMNLLQADTQEYTAQCHVHLHTSTILFSELHFQFSKTVNIFGTIREHVSAAKIPNRLARPMFNTKKALPPSSYRSLRCWHNGNSRYVTASQDMESM
jgi:hypothetical protein